MEPAAGLGEMGAHHMVVDIHRDSFLIDCGVLFPAPWDVGVDHLAPPLGPATDRARSGRLRGLLLTHGHRDHLGAVSHLLRAVPRLPVFGTPFTIALLRRVLGRGFDGLDAHVVTPGAGVDLGETTATWFAMTHSIPGACSLALESPHGTVVHSGDFRVQEDPFLGPASDSHGLRALGDRGVDLALVDSTGSAIPGRTLSERVVADHLVEALSAVEGLALVTVFSSHVERVAACIHAALRTGRTPALYGRSLETTISIARDLGLFEEWGSHLRSVDQVARLGRRGLVIVTGTQGEARAPLARIARGEDSRIRLGPGDTVLWSARVIPGNERSVGLVVNRLVDADVTVVPPWAEGGRGLHCSGHGRRDEVAEWLSWVRPRVVLPIHGEAWHLQEHRRALLASTADSEVVSLRSGGSLSFARGGTVRVEPGKGRAELPVGVRSELWDAAEPTLRERRRMAKTGAVTGTVAAGRVGIVSVGVFARAGRAEAESHLSAVLLAALATLVGSIEEREERLRLTLRRAVKALTGEQVECAVRISRPTNGKERLY